MSDEETTEDPELARKKAKKRMVLLVKKALDEATPLEEARTCSFLVLKICQEFGFKIIDPQTKPVRTPRTSNAAKIEELFRMHQDRLRHRRPPPGVYMGPNDRVHQAPGLRGVCLHCRKFYEAQEIAVWMGSRQGYVHRDCLAEFQMKGT